jgi:hypothetical protein
MMRKLIVLLLTLGVIGTVLAQEAYHPARVGLSWTYANGETQTFSGTRDLNGEEVLVLTRFFAGNPVSEDYLSYTAEGVRSHGTAAGGQLILFEPPLLVYPAGSLEVGQTWRSHTSLGDLEITLTAEVLGLVGVETPLGRFNALRIRQHTLTDTGGQTLLDLYFVPSVGIVRFVTQDGGAIDLIETNF